MSADDDATPVSVPLPSPAGDRADAALGGNASQPVIRGAAARGLLYGVSTGLIALAFAFVLRAIGPEEFARLSIAIAVATIAQGIGDTAVASVAQRLLVETPASERPALHARLVGFRLLLMPVVSALAIAFAFAAGYDGTLIVAIAVVCASTTITAIGSGIATPLAIELRSDLYAVFDFSRQVAVAAGLLVAVVASASLLGYAAVYVGAAVIAGVVAILLVEPRWRTIALPDRASIRLVAHEAAWLAVAITVNTLFLKVLIVVASLRTTDEEVGMFAAAMRVTEVAGGLSLIMAAVAYPLLTHAAGDGDHARFANAVHRVVDGVLLMIGLAVVVLVAGSSTLIEIFAGDEYRAAAEVLRVQAFALVAAAVTQALVWALLALRAERNLVLTNLVGLAVLVGGGVVLTGQHGAIGAAWAAVAGELALAGCTLFALAQTRRGALPSGWRLLRATGLTVACAGGALLSGLPELPAVLLAVAAFTGGAFLLRLVPAELVRALPGRRAPAA